MTTDGTDERTHMMAARSDAEIRGEVRREVTGLTREQLGDLIAAAEGGEDPAGSADGHRAAVRMTELKRIRNLVTHQVFDGYTPAGDPEERGQGHPASGGVRPPEQRGLYQVLARCTEPEHPGVAEITNFATAGSVEEAAAKVRRAKEGRLYGPEGLYRIVEVFEDIPSNSARHTLDARSQASAEIGCAAGAVVGSYEPGPEASDLFEVLTDFFHRTVVYPWHLAYPGDRGDDSTPRRPQGSDHGRPLARLLLAHLEALGTPLEQATGSSASAPPQHDADAYGQELARIRAHVDSGTTARATVFQALAAAGHTPQEADEIVSRLEAGAIASAHSGISENSAPDGSTPGFDAGWDAGVESVSSELLAIADATAAQRGRAASSAQLTAHLARQTSPAPAKEPAPAPAPVPPLYARRVLAVAEGFTWASAASGTRHWPDGEFLDVALRAVRAEERAGYIERLEAFVEQHRERLEELLRAYGPGSRPASHGRYALIGQPETLVILERMEANPFGLRSEWEKELETVFLDDLEFAWGPRIRLSR
ncbi:hypothetical protein AB4225_28935 [Streptomyces sp. 2RAF24]|uniref:hypothetical protein n=1 Tax=Streptomyces sp. 2RAF24 TaxID=3232997 RepID=UPI003F9A569D